LKQLSEYESIILNGNQFIMKEEFKDIYDAVITNNTSLKALTVINMDIDKKVYSLCLLIIFTHSYKTLKDITFIDTPCTNYLLEKFLMFELPSLESFESITFKQIKDANTVRMEEIIKCFYHYSLRN
jgi:hypothetical protein